MLQEYWDKYRVAYTGWLRSLTELGMRLRDRNRKWRILIYMTPQGFDIYLRRSKKLKHLGSLAPDTDPRQVTRLRKKIKRAKTSREPDIILRLSPQNVLRKIIQLPKGAADVIEPVIKNQMRRLVPWPEDDTCFSYEIEGQSEAGDQLDIAVVAASHSFIKSAQEVLAKLEIQPTVVEYREALDTQPGVELVTSDHVQVERTVKVLHKVAVLTTIACLSVSAIGLARLYTKWVEYSDIATELQQSKSIVARLNRKNRESLRLFRQKTYLIERKQITPPVVLVLETLSKHIPDNAWLTRMEISGRKVIIAGQARDTTSLVRRLEATQMLEKVRFSAPTTRVGVADLETFSIQASTIPAKGTK